MCLYLFILQCLGVINLGGEVGCMISEGPWVFVGIPDVVKVGRTNLLKIKLIAADFNDILPHSVLDMVL